MLIFARLKLRQNWPLMVAALAFLFVYLLFNSIHQQPTADFYQPKIGDKVEYSTFLAQHSIRAREYPALFVLGTAAIALATLVGITRISPHNAIFTLILVILTQWWTCRMMGDSSPQDGTILREIQSIQFKQINYKLTLSSTLGSGADWVERDFFVHECDATDQICTLIKFSLDEKYASSGRPSEGALIIDSESNTLHLQIDGQKILIVQ